MLFKWPNGYRCDWEHDRIIYVPKSIKTIEDEAFSKSTFPVSIIAATDFTKEEWYDRFGSDFSAVILFKDDPACVDYYNVKDIRVYDLWCDEGYIIRHDGTLMYYPCSPNNSICRIPSSVVAIDPWAFYDNEYIEKLVLPHMLTWYPDLTKMKKLKEIVVSDDTIQVWLDEVLFNRDRTVLVKYPSYKTDFSYRIPDSVLEIREDAFADCSCLKKLTYSVCIDRDLSNLSGLREVECVRIEENSFYSIIDGVIFNKEKTKLFKYPYSKGEETYIIPEWVEEIDEEAFSEYIPELIVIPSHWKSIPQCLLRKRIIIEVPENNPYLMTIDGVIYSKDKRKLIRYSVEKKEESFTIPKEVEEIGSYAFVYCKYLTEVKMHEKVNMIQDNAFYYCSVLRDVDFLSGEPVFIQPDEFIGCPHIYFY